ncbi:putative zinc finger protein CONSTANS-LIKE 10-like [Capsicum annuum]|nr:putative zinc finger protein CONSTANS-LIKE 10-like [Capsicum annuum]KAF3666154.1 putative zinc finger protein CONSTANS-LIKE 10-like [Capsicum annuum]
MVLVYFSSISKFGILYFGSALAAATVADQQSIPEYEHEAQIKTNFKLKAGRILVGLLSKARVNYKRPRWILPENWQKSIDHWATDLRFKQISEMARKLEHLIRKKKTPRDPDVWVEPRAQLMYDDESREEILALNQQIVELSRKAKASQARKGQRDIQYVGMKAQFDALLASGGFPLVPVM